MKSLRHIKKANENRFVGYVLEIGYDKVTIITSDAYKLAVGGLPRNCLLMMIPTTTPNDINNNCTDDDDDDLDYKIPPHFTLLRVVSTAPTPLDQQQQQTYFDLHKKQVAILDPFTDNDLRWGALKTTVLGMFYNNPDTSEIEFSGDVNNYVSADNYRVYSPTDEYLDIIVNSLVKKDNSFAIGRLRSTECQLTNSQNIRVNISPADFMATRTAMFGKTRLGKSNIIKLIAQSLIKTAVGGTPPIEKPTGPAQSVAIDNNKGGGILTPLNKKKTVGQLIFDIEGEYANDNPEDNNRSLRSAYPNECTVYAFKLKPGTESWARLLRVDFYKNPSDSHKMHLKMCMIYSHLVRERAKLERF